MLQKLTSGSYDEKNRNEVQGLLESLTLWEVSFLFLPHKVLVIPKAQKNIIRKCVSIMVLLLC